MSRTQSRTQRSLFTLEETTIVPSDDLRAYLKRAHDAGGRLRRSSICTDNLGRPAYAVTIAWRA